MKLSSMKWALKLSGYFLSAGAWGYFLAKDKPVEGFIAWLLSFVFTYLIAAHKD